MIKPKQPTVKKFKKEDNICNVCQQEKKLSKDHVPPQACPLANNIVISKLLNQMTGDRSFRRRISQNGVTYETICSNCNNNIGSRYDRALGEFSKKIESFIKTKLILPSSFEIECQPNAIMRSVLGHLLAAKTETDRVIIDKLIRHCILNPSLPIDDNIHIFYWVYSYETTIILRDFGMPEIRGNLQICGFFSLIKFYPVAFLVAYKVPCYEKLLSLHQFNQLAPNAKANIQIDLRPVKSSTWTEECRGFENYLMGATAK